MKDLLRRKRPKHKRFKKKKKKVAQEVEVGELDSKEETIKQLVEGLREQKSILQSVPQKPIVALQSSDREHTTSRPLKVTTSLTPESSTAKVVSTTTVPTTTFNAILTTTRVPSQQPFKQVWPLFHFSYLFLHQSFANLFLYECQNLVSKGFWVLPWHLAH